MRRRLGVHRSAALEVHVRPIRLQMRRVRLHRTCLRDIRWCRANELWCSGCGMCSSDGLTGAEQAAYREESRRGFASKAIGDIPVKIEEEDADFVVGLIFSIIGSADNIIP
eukprot:IDg8236t1